MSETASPLKALSIETKALIIVSEFEARRMPMFQLRAVLNAVVRDDGERKNIIDLVEKDLRATGYPDDQLNAFLSDLIASPQGAAPGSADTSVASTRRLRSPFAMGFENPAAEPAKPPEVIGFAPRGVVAGPLVSEGAGRPPSTTSLPAVGAGLFPAPIPAPAVPRGTASFTARRTGVNIVPPGPVGITPTPPSAPIGSVAPGAAAPPAAIQPIRGPINPPMTPHPPTAPSQTAEPLQPVGQRTIMRHEHAFGKTSSSASQQTVQTRPIILVADDDKRIRLVFRLRLEEAGFGVIELGDGQEAWDRIQQGGISLVVLDMKMPGLHGLEVLSRMIDKQLQIPVIVCSAYDQLENEFVVQTHPRLKYLVKPVAPENLVAVARELLGRK